MNPQELRIGLVLIFLILLGGAVEIVTHKPPAPANAQWEMYKNSVFGISATYPPTVAVHERAVDQDSYFEAAFDDTATQARYLFVRSYGRQSDIDQARGYFAGP